MLQLAICKIYANKFSACYSSELYQATLSLDKPDLLNFRAA